MSLPFFVPFFNRDRSHRQLQDLLMAHADALVAGTLDRDALLEPFEQGTRDQVEDLLSLAERISETLTEVTPSEQFIIQLRRQLVDAGALGHQSLWGRMRQLPPRTQLAAGIGGVTLTAGVVLLASRTLPDALDSWRHRRAATA